MLDFPEFYANTSWYVGLVWALFMGWAASSYASNFAYRLPRGETPFGREPYCGDCDAPLTPKDLFPIFSWLVTGGKCRYCGAKVPVTYCLFELGFTLFIGTLYLFYGFEDLFVLFAFAGMIFQIMVMMLWDDRYVSPILSFVLMVLGMMHLLIAGNSFVDGLLAVFFGLMAGLLAQALLTRKPLPKDIYALPRWIWLLVAVAPWIKTLL